MSPDDEPRIVVDSATIERPFSWVFFYNTKRYLETGDYRYQLAGNGPVMVNKHDGSIEFWVAWKPVDTLIEEYERELTAP